MAAEVPRAAAVGGEALVRRRVNGDGQNTLVATGGDLATHFPRQPRRIGATKAVNHFFGIFVRRSVAWSAGLPTSSLTAGRAIGRPEWPRDGLRSPTPVKIDTYWPHDVNSFYFHTEKWRHRGSGRGSGRRGCTGAMVECLAPIGAASRLAG